MNLNNVFITKEQHKILAPFFKYLSSSTSLYTIVEDMPQDWGKTRVSIIKSVNALDSCGLGYLTDIILDDIIHALYVKSEHPEAANYHCCNCLTLSKLTPVVYNLIQVAKKDKRFEKINSIPRKDLNTFFPKLNEGNVERFISFCKDGLIDIPTNIKQRIEYDSLINTPYKTSINLGIELLALHPSADFLDFIYESLSNYFTIDPLMTDIKVSLLKVALKSIDVEKARILEKKLNNDVEPLCINRHISINIDIEAIQVSRSKMNLKDRAFYTLLLNVVKCIEKENELDIFKDFINKNDYVQKIAATLTNINDKTLAYLYSHLEFNCDKDEDWLYKEKVIHAFFEKVILLDNKSTPEIIVELMKNTLLFHEMEKDLPMTSSIKRRHKI